MKRETDPVVADPIGDAAQRIAAARTELSRRVAQARHEFEAHVATVRDEVAGKVADVLELETGPPPLAGEGVVDWRSRFRAARTDLLRSTVVQTLANFGGIVALGIYLKLVFGIDAVTRYQSLVVPVVIGSAVLGSSIGFYLARRLTRFFGQAEPANEIDLRAEITEDLRRDALNFPVYQGLADFFVWLVVGTILSVVIALLVDDPLHTFLHLFMASSFTGEVVGLFVFYQSEAMIGRNVLPLLLGDRKTSSVSGVLPVPTFARILLLFFSTSLGPLLYLLLLGTFEKATNEVLVFVIVGVIVLGLWQVTFILDSISTPIGRLARLFERVRRGERLGDRARIYRTDALGRFSEMLDDLLATMEERDLIRTTFGRYVSPKVAEAILEGRVPLGGSRRHAAVLFVDIRGFTALTESARPEAVVEFLNDYLQRIVEIVTRHEGIVDKFLGDGVLAVWGVPLEIARPEERAVEAALEMFQAVARINEKHSLTGKQIFRIGVAVHAGEVIAGNIGSAEKTEFGVIGNAVNVCARIEDENRGLGSVLSVSEAVWRALPEASRGRFQEVPDVVLRGKSEPMTLHRLFP